MDVFDERVDGVGQALPPGCPIRFYDSIRKGMRTMRDRYRNTA